MAFPQHGCSVIRSTCHIAGCSFAGHVQYNARAGPSDRRLFALHSNTSHCSITVYPAFVTCSAQLIIIFVVMSRRYTWYVQFCALYDGQRPIGCGVDVSTSHLTLPLTVTRHVQNMSARSADISTRLRTRCAKPVPGRCRRRQTLASSHGADTAPSSLSCPAVRPVRLQAPRSTVSTPSQTKAMNNSSKTQCNTAVLAMRHIHQTTPYESTSITVGPSSDTVLSSSWS